MTKILPIAGLMIAAGITAAMLPQVISGTTDPEIGRCSFTFSYQLSLEKIPSEARELEIWIPLPPSDENQVVAKYSITTDLAHETYTDPDFGNSILHFNLEDQIPSQISVRLDFDVSRIESNLYPARRKAGWPASESDLARFLAPSELVPIGGRIAEEAAGVVDKTLPKLKQVRALYDHLFQTMKYDKSGEGWGRGDALYACDVRRGNCTDIHSLFIGMTRSLGIPARFVIGFPLPIEQAKASVGGYHCWAEFYIDDMGWVSVDISEAIKHPDRRDYYFGRLDPNRITFTTGRDIKLNTRRGQQKLNYFIYPFVLVDGQPFAGATYSFAFARK